MSMTKLKAVACVLLALAVAVVKPWALAQEKEPAPTVSQVELEAAGVSIGEKK